jgi:hypothetical protein
MLCPAGVRGAHACFGQKYWGLKMKKLLLCSLVCLLLAFGIAVPASAQTVTGTLSGRVTDATGAVIPSVKVTAKSEETGFTHEATTNEEGYYLISFLPLGKYSLSVSLRGFASVSKRGVLIELNKATVSNFELKPSAVESTVEVTGETPQIETTVGELKHSLDARTIEAIPLAGRNIISLSEQFPGFQNVQWIDSSNNPTNSTGSYAAFNGTGSRNTTFQIDGVNNDDSSENQNRQSVNVSTVKEVQVLQNAYSAEFGRAAGAVFLVQTKSGTNQFHGEAYDFIQNDIFNANGYFANRAGLNATTGQPLQPRARVRRNQYGWTVGGPIFRDKLFFFHSGERVSNFSNSTISRFKFFDNELTARACAPGEISRPGRAVEPAGNFCLDPAVHPNLTADLAFVQSVLDLFKNPLIQGTAPNNPAACSDMILSGRLNRCVTLSGSNRFPDSDYSLKTDYKPFAQTVVALRYQYSRQKRDSFRIIDGDNFGRNNNRQYNIGANVTHVFSNRQSGEFRFGFGNRTTLQDVTDGNHIPVVRFANTLSPSGTVIGTSTNVPINRRQHDYQYVYNHTYVMNKHTLRGGVDARWQILDDVSGDRSRGFWTFSSFEAALGTAFSAGPAGTAPGPNCGTVRNPFVPGDPAQPASICPTPPTAPSGFAGWENLLRGLVTSYQQGYGNPLAENRFGEVNLYVQDDWRIFRNLTLNLGFRWEAVRAPVEKENRFVYGYGDDFNNFEPRIGFAWQPNLPDGWLQKLFGKPNDFVIRGGYGIYHSRIFQSIFSQNQLSIRTQPPNGFAAAFALGTVAQPFCNFQVSNPAFTDPQPIGNCANPFVFTPGAAVGLSTVPACATSAAGCGPAGAGVRVTGGRFTGTLLIPDSNLQDPYTQQWNLTLERTLPWRMALQVGYAGNRGIGLPFFDSDNDAVFGITSNAVFVDVGGGNFQPVVFDRVCIDFTDPICNNNGLLTGFNVATSGSLRTWSSLTSTTATLAQKGIVIVSGVPHGYISLNDRRLNERRPNNTMSRNVLMRNFAWTYYHAMNVKLTKRLSNGLTFSGFWTLSKTIDTGSEPTFTGVDSNAPSGQVNPARSLRGLSNYDTRHRVVLTYAYDLPFHRAQQGWMGRILGGWAVSGTTTLQSGQPFTIAAGYDVNLDGLGGDRPFVLDPSIAYKHVDNGNSFIRTGCPTPIAATTPCPDTLSQLTFALSQFNPGVTALSNGSQIPLLAGQNGEGTLARNMFFGDGMIVFDTAFAKRTRIREGMQLELRMEWYNLFNHPTFQLPSGRTVVSTTPLGRITGQRNPANFVNSARDNGSRMGQFVVRFTF